MTNVKKATNTPPLRYTGGKWMLADWIIAQFPSCEIYVEPFCGGASVFFRKAPSPLEVLNDLDGSILNFFDVLRTRQDELVRAIDLTPYARAEYQRSLEPCDDPLERARRFYIAVWQSYSASTLRQTGWRRIKSVGSGTSVTGTWKRLDGLLAAAHRLKDAQLENVDALECIDLYDGPHTLFYVDPPYVMSARSQKRALYHHEMTTEQHQRLSDVLHNVQGMVALSGYASSLYDDLYADWVRVEQIVSTNGNVQATESLWLSPNTTSLSALPLFSYQRGTQ